MGSTTSLSRRGFLKAFAAVPVATAVAPVLLEELLPTRTIFLPPRGGWTPYGLVEMNAISFVGDYYGASIIDDKIMQLIQRRMNDAMLVQLTHNPPIDSGLSIDGVPLLWYDPHPKDGLVLVGLDQVLA